jgi:hypothetical protein
MSCVLLYCKWMFKSVQFTWATVERICTNFGALVSFEIPE